MANTATAKAATTTVAIPTTKRLAEPVLELLEALALALELDPEAVPEAEEAAPDEAAEAVPDADEAAPEDAAEPVLEAAPAPAVAVEEYDAGAGPVAFRAAQLVKF